MFSTIRIAALAALTGFPVAALAQSAASGPAPANAPSLPNWSYGGAYSQSRDVATRPAEGAPEAPVDRRSVNDREPHFDPAMQPAVYREVSTSASPVPAAGDDRRLAPRSQDAAERLNASSGLFPDASNAPSLGFKYDSLYSTGAALAFVLGLFFLCTWLLRRGSKKHATILPAEVVSVLGRVALAPKQMAELLRVGNKLVLVALTPEGAKSLTEVTDAVEVDRLMGLCQKAVPNSSSREFDRVFRELSKEPATGGFLGAELPLAATLPELPPLFSTRGGKARA